MAMKPKRPCRSPRCPALTSDGWCERHAPTEQRLSSFRRGYDRRWERVRDAALRRDCHLCVMCQAEQRVTIATLVDHIVPIVVDPGRRLDLNNLQSLCAGCHKAKTDQDLITYAEYGRNATLPARHGDKGFK